MTMLSILFGAIVGISLGLTGGGGAIFAVPMLAYGLGLPAREAVGISLASVGLTSLVGFLQKWKHGEAEIQTGLIFAFAGMFGAPLGAWLARRIADPILMLLFAGLMVTIAIVMWRKGRPGSAAATVCVPVEPRRVAGADYQTDGPRCQRDASGSLILTSRCARLLMLTGVFAGVLSGMFGVGGGFIIVPSLIVFSSMSMSRAVGTSLMVIALVSASGVVSLVSAGQSLQADVTVLFVVGGLIGLLVGQRISHRLSASTSQRTFSVAILLVAVFVLYRNLS